MIDGMDGFFDDDGPFGGDRASGAAAETVLDGEVIAAESVSPDAVATQPTTIAGGSAGGWPIDPGSIRVDLPPAVRAAASAASRIPAEGLIKVGLYGYIVLVADVPWWIKGLAVFLGYRELAGRGIFSPAATK